MDDRPISKLFIFKYFSLALDFTNLDAIDTVWRANISTRILKFKETENYKDYSRDVRRLNFITHMCNELLDKFNIFISAINLFREPAKYMEPATWELILHNIASNPPVMIHVAEFIPEQLFNTQSIKTIIEKNPSLFEFILIVYPHLINYDVCSMAVKYRAYSYSMLRYIPERFKDDILCAEALKVNKYAIQYVPNNILDRNYELCLSAVSEVGSLIYCVPTQLRDLKMCRAALNSRCGIYIENFIPDHILQEIKYGRSAERAHHDQYDRNNNIRYSSE